MKIKDEWIGQAIETLKDVGIVDENGEYDSVFKGYLSSFGASIVQCGLLPSVLAFNKNDKVKIVEAVVRILNECVGYNITSFVDYLCTSAVLHDRLLKEISQAERGVSQESDDLLHDRLLKEISQAVAALKLGLRVYRPKTQSNDERS